MRGGDRLAAVDLLREIEGAIQTGTLVIEEIEMAQVPSQLDLPDLEAEAAQPRAEEKEP